MAKKINFIVSLETYPVEVMISLGQTDLEYKKALDKYGIEWADNECLKTAGRFTLYTDRNVGTIRMLRYPTTCEDYGTLQHEIFHCVTLMLDHLGMKFVPYKSDEAYAYLTGYLTRLIYEKIF